MSSESQVRSLLDVVTFILERLSPSEAFDEKIFSDYFRKHHDIVDARHHAPYEAIIIPESDAFQDDINNHEEKDKEPLVSKNNSTKKNNPSDEDILFRLGDVDIMKMPNKKKDPTSNYESHGYNDNIANHIPEKMQSHCENTVTTAKKAIVIKEVDAFGDYNDNWSNDDGLEDGSDSDGEGMFYRGDIEDYGEDNTNSEPIKEPIKVSVVSATIVNRKKDLDTVEFKNEYIDEDLEFIEEDFNNKVNEQTHRKSSENGNREELKDEQMESEEDGVLVGHGDFDNALRDFSEESKEILVTAVTEELKDGKVDFQEALNKIKIAKRRSRKKENSKIIALICGMCQEHFEHKNLLNKHVKEEHNRMMCWNETCDYVADTMIEMMEHEKVHKKERFKCHICGKEGLIARQLLIHLKKKHLPNLSNDECPLCSFKGSWIESHIQMMHSQMECVCHICDKTLMGPGKLKLHIYRQHTLGRNFPCKTCNKVCSTRQSLERHEQIHTVKEKTAPCDECDKKFLTILLLNEHKNNCHKPKKLLCSQCDFKTYKQSILKQHSVVHSEDRPFQCHTCAHSFKTKEVLRKHEFYHTGIRKEECLVCGKKFKNAASLKIHKKQHEGHYDAYCQPCDKKFVQEYNYKVHVEKHHAREHLP